MEKALPTPTRRTVLENATQRLEAAGVEDARRNAEWMLGDVVHTSRAMLYAYPERTVPPEAAAAFEAMLVRRLRREPLQYILGHTEFFGLRLQVTPAVLIPRPETEQVVEAALARLPAGGRVLDVGTGSGCIPLAIKQARPDATVYACDVSEAALDVARANAAAHRLDVTFFEADVRADAFAQEAPGDLDLLVSNPPYVTDADRDDLAPEVRDHEPALALFSGADPLLFYRLLTDRAGMLLAPGGAVVFETHAVHGAAVCDLLRAAGFADVTLREDLAGRPRIAVGKGNPKSKI